MTTDRMAPSKERFMAAMSNFFSAGVELVNAWDDRETGFNADEEAPLPAALTPPMSLEEWFYSLLEHYQNAFEKED